MEYSNFQCRVCLADGKIQIYGEKEPSLAEDIIRIGDIQIEKEDDFPKHICESCFEKLMGAISFRNTAQHTDNFLRNTCNLLTDSEELIIQSTSWKSSSYKNFINTDDSKSKKSLSVEKNYCISNVFTSYDNVDNYDNDDNESQNLTNDDNISDSENTSDSGHDQKHPITCVKNITVKHLNMINCQVCDELILDETYEKHLEIHKTKELEVHKTNLHQKTSQISNEKNLKVKCMICEKFVSKYYLKIHTKLHGSKEVKEELLRPCPYCDKCFAFSYVKTHIQKMHKDEWEKEELAMKQSSNKSEHNLICDKCGKIFKKKHNLCMHLLTHDPEFKHKCMFCPYRGIHPSLLKIHVRTHTKDYNYRCSQCPAKFLTKSNLNTHLQRHKTSGDFQCESCQKCFYSKTMLKQHHEVAHSGTKRHICNMCGKAFGCRNYMISHQMKFHKRKKLTDGKGRLPSYLANEIKATNTT